MAKLPTLQVVTGNGPVTINASDFDPNVHELATPVDAPAPPVAKTPAQEPQEPVAGNQPQEPVNTPETGANEPVAGVPPKLFVAKAGKRFKVVNESGTDADGFQKTGYADEDQAWAAIKAVME